MQCTALIFTYYAQCIMLRRKLVPHFVPSCGLFIDTNIHKDYHKIFPIMLALCSMLSKTCYAQNYAGLGLNKTTGIKMH